MGGKRALAGLDLDNILVTKSRRRGSTVSETMAGTPLIDETTTKPVLQGPPEVKTVDPGDDDDEATVGMTAEEIEEQRNFERNVNAYKQTLASADMTKEEKQAKVDYFKENYYGVDEQQQPEVKKQQQPEDEEQQQPEVEKQQQPEDEEQQQPEDEKQQQPRDEEEEEVVGEEEEAIDAEEEEAVDVEEEEDSLSSSSSSSGSDSSSSSSGSDSGSSSGSSYNSDDSTVTSEESIEEYVANTTSKNSKKKPGKADDKAATGKAATGNAATGKAATGNAATGKAAKKDKKEKNHGVKRPPGTAAFKVKQQLDHQVREALFGTVNPMKTVQYMSKPYMFTDEYKFPVQWTEKEAAVYKTEKAFPQVHFGLFCYTEQQPNENGGGSASGGILGFSKFHAWTGSAIASRNLGTILEPIARAQTAVPVMHDEYEDFHKNVFGAPPIHRKRERKVVTLKAPAGHPALVGERINANFEANLKAEVKSEVNANHKRKLPAKSKSKKTKKTKKQPKRSTGII